MGNDAQCENNDKGIAKMTGIKQLKILCSVLLVFGIGLVYSHLPDENLLEEVTPTATPMATLTPEERLEGEFSYDVSVMTPNPELVVTATPAPTAANQSYTASLSNTVIAMLEEQLNLEVDDTVYTTLEEYFGSSSGGTGNSTSDAPYVSIPSFTGESVSTNVSIPVLYCSSMASDTVIARYNDYLEDEYKVYTYWIAQAYGVSYEMLMAIMYNESRFVVDATNVNTNGTTDRGLMQINDVCYSTVAAHLGLTSADQLYDPYVSIQAGAYLMYIHMCTYADEADALLCYQYGQTGAQYYFENGTRPTKYTTVIDYRTKFISANLT